MSRCAGAPTPVVAGISENLKYVRVSLRVRIWRKLVLEAMPGLTWNQNVSRIMCLIDSDDIQPAQNIPDHHRSQDIEKSQIRTRKVTRTYLGENRFWSKHAGQP